MASMRVGNVKKAIARTAYLAAVAVILMAWLGLWLTGSADEIPETLFLLLMPGTWWRWMWC